MKRLLNIFNPNNDGYGYSDIIHGVLFGLLSLSWIFIIIKIVDKYLIYEFETTIKFLTFIVVFIGVIVAVWKIFLDSRWNKSEKYLEESKELFEKAYKIFNQKGEKYIPDNNRSTWITTARLLTSAEKLSHFIKTSSHLKIYKEVRRYWRAQFHSLIYKNDKSFPEDYFSESVEKFTIWVENDRDPISESSLTYLYKFVKWPEGEEDQLKNVKLFTDNELQTMKKFGPTHLANLLIKSRKKNKTWLENH